MKTSVFFLAGFLVSGFCALSVAGNTKSSSSPDQLRPISAAETNFTDQQIVEAWGWLVAQEREVAGIEISEPELAAFLKGVKAGLRDQPSPYDLDKIFPDVQYLQNSRREKIVQAAKRRNEAEAEAFFADLQNNTNVVELPSGVRYEIIKPGTGSCPKPNQTVNVHYTGHLINGTEFIQMGPVDMIFVSNHVSRGLFEGIQKINPGGAIKIYVPPRVAGADWETMGASPGSAMIFDVELFAVKETSPQDLADALMGMAPAPPPVPFSGRFTEAQVFETWGWNVAMQTHAAQFGWGESECSAFLKGMAAGVKGQRSPYDPQPINSEIERYVNDRLEKARLAFKRKQLAEMEDLFAALKKDTNVVILPDGLGYEIIKPGSGLFPKPGQFVNVNYTGRLINGRVFDSTAFGPLDIDPGTVIPGWTEGIRKIKKGGKIKLYIPPSLGYGDVATSGIPPDSTLIFEIELLDIKDKL